MQRRGPDDEKAALRQPMPTELLLRPNRMRRYLLQRLVQLIVLLLVGSVVDWYLIYLTPGSPVYALLGTNASPSQVRVLKRSLGLDKPLPVQYVTWLNHVLHGNLGSSFISGLQTTTLLAQRVPASLQLVIASFVLGLLVALVLGSLAAIRPRSVVSTLVSAYSSLSLSLPTFWLGIILILIF